MQRIRPCLWFDAEAEQAARYYTKIFKKSKIGRISHYPEGSPHGTAGSVLTVQFFLEGQEFLALNGGPEFKFSEAISLMVDVKNQKELDDYWKKLVRGGQESQCGWLKDKFGLSWQIVPARIVKMMSDKNPARVARVFQAIQPMSRLDIKKLEAAYNAKPARRATRPRRQSPRLA